MRGPVDPLLSQPALPIPGGEPAVEQLARRFPEDLKVALATARGLRAGPPTAPRPADEPWPTMRVPS